MNYTQEQAQQLANRLAALKGQLEGQELAYVAFGNIVTAGIEKLAREFSGPNADLYRQGIADRLTGISQQIQQLAAVPPDVISAFASSTASLLAEKTGGLAMAQQITGYSSSTIYNLVSLGKLPATKVGKRLCFTQSALNAYINREKPLTDRSALDKLAEVMNARITVSHYSSPGQSLNPTA